MKRLQAFKFVLLPNGAQQRDMRRFAGSCRFVFNRALALQQANYQAGERFIGYLAMAKHLTQWRHSTQTPWLKDAPVHPLQHALKDLERAYKNFFARRAGFPRFKRKGSGESFRYPDAKQFEIDQPNSRIKLPKLGWIRYRNSREILGTAKNITIRQCGGKCYASIQTEREVEPPRPTATTAIGIDVGIARLATLSDGSFIAPLNSFKKHQQRLARYQRRMSRKAKFSNNWKKAKIKVQKVYTQIANARRDFLHKTTTTISKNHALVCIEDLQVRSLSRSSKGTSEQHGIRVRQKIRAEPCHSRSGMGRVQAATGIQDAMGWRHAVGGACAPHQSDLPLLRARRTRKPTHTSTIPMCLVWAYRQCGCGWRDQCFRARTALVSLWRGRLWPWSQDDDATSLCEAGTHRSDYARGSSCIAP